MDTREKKIEHARGVSLRTRLTLWVFAIYVLIKLVTGCGYYLIQRENAQREFDTMLLERASNMVAAIEGTLPSISATELYNLSNKELGFVQFERFAVDVVDHEGKSIVNDVERWPKTIQSLALPAIENDAPLQGDLRDETPVFENTQGTPRAIALPLTDSFGSHFALIVVTTDAYIDRQLAMISRVLVIGASLGSIASLISGWFIAGIAVQPLHRLKEIAGQLRPESISHELTIDSKNAEVAELTDELNQARERISNAFAAQERFLSNISHEIKTPIATLLLEAQTLKRDQLDENAAYFVDSTEEEMRRLGKLVESFLMLTRVQDGRDLERRDTYPANELVMDSVENCAVMAEQYGVQLVPTLLDNDGTIDAVVIGDSELLRTMIDNLLRNAIRFAPKGSDVRISTTCKDSCLYVAVSDKGPGLPPELLDKIFDRFVQSKEEVRRGRGHGLGLSIAQSIAELHDGEITVRNLETAGAEFTVRVPVELGR
ncbi:MAG: hypothetical protein H6815_02175 [Phycisphaeraceae bacterium]|nr:hypothetical protein [Phycisphaerales bacterium]MCB9859235.1 hypothetical protein [Phycisphaeraceae bacterium]